MQGIEFVMTNADDEQNLFQIEKRLRISPTETQTISAYYILNGQIFRAPTMKRIIESKTQNGAFLLNKALDVVS